MQKKTKIILGVVGFFMFCALMGILFGKEEPKEERTVSATEVQMPEITKEMIDMVVSDIKQNTVVKDAAVIIKDDEISIAVIVINATTEDAAKNIGDNAVRRLGSVVSVFNDVLEGPTKDYYGDIYKHYDLIVGVYHSANTDEPVIQGYKSKSSNTIKWK